MGGDAAKDASIRTDSKPGRATMAADLPQLVGLLRTPNAHRCSAAPFVRMTSAYHAAESFGVRVPVA